MNKRIILNRIDGKISDAHDAMDAGLPLEKYNRKVGEVEAYNDMREYIVGLSDDDAGDDELEELST